MHGVCTHVYLQNGTRRLTFFVLKHQLSRVQVARQINSQSGIEFDVVFYKIDFGELHNEGGICK